MPTPTYPAILPEPDDDQEDLLSDEFEQVHDGDLEEDDDQVEIVVSEHGTHWGDDRDIALADFGKVPKPAADRANDALDAFAQGDATPAVVSLLSDIDRAGRAVVEERWPLLSLENRVRVMRSLAEVAEERFDLHFGQVLRIMALDISPVVRQLAVTSLWEDEGTDLPGRFLDMVLNDLSPDVQAAATQALTRCVEAAAAGDRADVDVSLLRDTLMSIAGDTTITHVLRRRALETLAVFAADGTEGSDLAIGRVIARAYDDDDPSIRASAVYAMGRTLDKRYLSTVMSELASDDAELRYEAARAAGELGDTMAVDDLTGLTTDDDAEVRAAAVASLGQIGGPGAIRMLRQLVTDEERDDGELVQAALDEALILQDPLRPGR